jgi:hypothetical protein
MFRFLKRKRVAVPLGVIVSLALAAGAFAYFTSTGSGTGNATVGSSSNYAVTVDAATGGPLYPGSGTTNLAYHVKNVSPGQQRVSSIAATLTTDTAGGVYNTSSSAFVDGCQASWFSVSNHPGTLPDNLAGGATHSGSADVVLNDSGTNQNPCQGVTPQLTVTAG